MIKIKRSQLADMRFVMAIQKLANIPMNTNTAHSIKKIIQTLDEARTEMSADYKSEIVEKFSQRDEEGKIAWEDANQSNFKVLEGKEAELREAQEEFGNKELEVPGIKVNLANLNGIQLSPAEMIQLEPIYFSVEKLEVSESTAN